MTKETLKRAKELESLINILEREIVLAEGEKEISIVAGENAYFNRVSDGACEAVRMIVKENLKSQLFAAQTELESL